MGREMIDFGCLVCGSDLEVTVDTDGSGFRVVPCPACLTGAMNEGYDEGCIDAEREHDEYI